MRGLLVSAALAAATLACGDDGAPPPPPATITVGAVTIATDPLTLTITPAGRRPDGAAGVPRGRHCRGDRRSRPLLRPARRRRRPADLWTRPTRATALDADGWLVLEGGARLRLAAEAGAADAALELDASAVDGAVLARVVLPMTAGEPLFGFGETFGSADASGQVRELQFRPDAGYESGINEAHVPVPLALWPRRGLGCSSAIAAPARSTWARPRPTSPPATFNLPERGPLRLRAVHRRPTPRSTWCAAYVAATARPAVPPRWAFAPQQWRNEHRSTAELLDDAQQMRALGIPGSTMWIDNPWQTGYNTFVVDETRFAGIDAALAELAALGYRVLVWSTPYLLPSGATADDYRTAAAAGLFVTDARGQPMSFPWNAGPVGMIDFTNPAAVAFWRERIARITARGVSGMKLDYGEDLVADLYGTRIELRTMAGDNQELHGIFARYYHDTYLGALPPGDGFLITRAGAWGEQDRNTAIWPGDLDSDFSRHGVDNGDGERNTGGLPAAIAGGLALSVSGYPFYGSDIGGYREGTPTSEVLIRWAQYAALGTIMQLGGGGPSHNPWDTALYPAPALEVYRTFARLHLDLNPLLWTLAVTAAADGTPVTRPCRFVYPGAACDDAMFLLGDAIVAAPVVTAGATTRGRLPPGRWIDWWTGAATTGDGITAHDRRRAPRAPAAVARRRSVRADVRARRRHPRAGDRAGRDVVRRPGLRPRASAVADARRRRRRGRAPRRRPGPGRGRTGGAYRLRFEPGSQYTVATFDLDTTAALATQVAATTAVTVDGVAAPAVADGAALASCPTACWLAEPGRLRVRVARGGAIEIR
jgi:hypothetical protein